MIIFLPISLNISFGCSKEPSHRDGSFEYPQNMFWLRNKKNHFLVHSYLEALCVAMKFALLNDCLHMVLYISGTCICKCTQRFFICDEQDFYVNSFSKYVCNL